MVMDGIGLTECSWSRQIIEHEKKQKGVLDRTVEG
jgi:hypothetical protein